MKLPLYLRVLLVLTVIGCAWLFWHDSTSTPDDASTATAEPEQALAPARTSATLPAAETVVDIFPGQSWLPPPPPPAASDTTPQPPPLPFTVSAQWRYQNQAKIVVLRGNNRQYILCNRCSVPGRIVPGKMLDTDYRLDKLTDTAVVLTYVPMKHVSTLRLDKH